MVLVFSNTHQVMLDTCHHVRLIWFFFGRHLAEDRMDRGRSRDILWVGREFLAGHFLLVLRVDLVLEDPGVAVEPGHGHGQWPGERPEAGHVRGW